MKFKIRLLLATSLIFLYSCSKDTEFDDSINSSQTTSINSNNVGKITPNFTSTPDSCKADTFKIHNDIVTCLDTIFMNHPNAFVTFSLGPDDSQYTVVHEGSVDPAAVRKIICRSRNEGAVKRCFKLLVDGFILGYEDCVQGTNCIYYPLIDANVYTTYVECD